VTIPNPSDGTQVFDPAREGGQFSFEDESLQVIDPMTERVGMGLKEAPKTISESFPGQHPYDGRIRQPQSVNHMGQEWMHQQIRPATREHLGTSSEHFGDMSMHHPDVAPLWEETAVGENNVPAWCERLDSHIRNGVSAVHRDKEQAHRQHFNDSALYTYGMYGPHETYVPQHGLYERAYNNWALSDEGKRFATELDAEGIHGPEQEQYLRHYHMEIARSGWQSNNTEEQTGRRKGLGEMDYYLGLEWLTPAERAMVYRHIKEHGFHDKNNYTISDIHVGDKPLSMGRLVANMHQRYAPVFSHHTRDPDATGQAFAVGMIPLGQTSRVNPDELYKDLEDSALGQRIRAFYENHDDEVEHLPRRADKGFRQQDKPKMDIEGVYALAGIKAGLDGKLEFHRKGESPHYEEGWTGDHDWTVEEVEEFLKPHLLARDMQGAGRKARNEIQAYLNPYLATEGVGAHSDNYTFGDMESLAHHWSEPFEGRGGLGKTHTTKLDMLHQMLSLEGERDGLLGRMQAREDYFQDESLESKGGEVLNIHNKVRGLMAPFGLPLSELSEARRQIARGRETDTVSVSEIDAMAGLPAALHPHNTFIAGTGALANAKVNQGLHGTTHSPEHHNEVYQASLRAGRTQGKSKLKEFRNELHGDKDQYRFTHGMGHAFGLATENDKLKRDGDVSHRAIRLIGMLGGLNNPRAPSVDGVQHPNQFSFETELPIKREDYNVRQRTHVDNYEASKDELNILNQTLKELERGMSEDERLTMERSLQDLETRPLRQHEARYKQLHSQREALNNVVEEYDEAENELNQLFEQREFFPEGSDERAHFDHLIEEQQEVLDEIAKKHYGENSRSSRELEHDNTHHTQVKGHHDAIVEMADRIGQEMQRQMPELYESVPPDTMAAWKMYTANQFLARQDAEHHNISAPVAGQQIQEARARGAIDNAHDGMSSQLHENGHEIDPDMSVSEAGEMIFGDAMKPYEERMVKNLLKKVRALGKPLRVMTMMDMVQQMGEAGDKHFKPMYDTGAEDVLNQLTGFKRHKVDYDNDPNYGVPEKRSVPRTGGRGGHMSHKDITSSLAYRAAQRLHAAVSTGDRKSELGERSMEIMTPSSDNQESLKGKFRNESLGYEIRNLPNELKNEATLHDMVNHLHGLVVSSADEYDPTKIIDTEKKPMLMHKPIGRGGHPKSKATIMSMFNSDGLRGNFGHIHDIPFAMDVKDGQMSFRMLPKPKKMRLLTPNMEAIKAMMPEHHHGHFVSPSQAKTDPRIRTDIARSPVATRANQVGEPFMDTPEAIHHKMDGPALLASLTNPDYIRKDMPEGLPSLQPMHRIFDVDDLEHLRGFTGDWVVSDYPEGDRMFVTKKDDDVKSKGSLTDEEKKAFKQVSDKDFLVDVIRRESGLYIFEVIEFDGKEVHDIPIQDRIKLLRGALQSVEGVEAPSASDTKLTDDVGLADAIKNIESDRILLRDAKSTYMKGEARHPKWVMYQKGNDVTLMVLERRGESPYTYRLGTGPIIHGEDLGDRAVKIEDDIYMDIGASFNAPEKYEVGDFVKVNVTSVTEGEASENQKVYTVHAPRIEGEAEGEPLVSTESLAMLAKADMAQSPLNIYRSDRHIRVSFEAGDVLYKATTRGSYWTVHTPVADNDYLIRLSESQRPFWSPVAGVMLKGDFSIEEREDKAEVHESKGDGKPLIPPRKIQDTNRWDKEKNKVMKKGVELLEKLLAKSGVGQVGASMSGPKGLGIDYGTPIQSPTGPTNPDDAKTMPDYDVRDIERDRKDEEEETKDVEEVDSKLELTEDKAVYHI